MSTLYWLLLAGTVLYAAAFVFETVMSFVRLRSSHEVYPHAGWEITHTTLVLVFTIFMISHGPYLPEISKLIFVPLFMVMIGFFVRATLQVYIFFGRTRSLAHTWVDHAFAWSHILILVPFLYSLWLVVNYIVTTPIAPLTAMLGWYIPGLIAAIVVTIVPTIYVLKHRY